MFFAAKLYSSVPTNATESSQAVSSQQTWPAYTCWPKLLLTLGEPLQAACCPTEIAEQLHAHSDTARFIAKQANYTRHNMWNNELTGARATIKLGLEAAEALPAGSDQPWLWWRSLNRLRTGIGRAKTTMRRWGYIDNTQSVNCDCGEPQTMAHLLSCRLLDEHCSLEDLTIVTERAKACARMWQHLMWRTREKRYAPIVSN